MPITERRNNNFWSMKGGEVKELSMVLCRSPHLLIGIIIELIVILAILIYTLVQFGSDPLLYFQIAHVTCVLMFLFTVYSSYEYIFTIRKSGIEEVVVAQCKAKGSLYGIAFFILLVPVLTISFIEFLFAAFSSICQNMPVSLYVHIFWGTFLDSLLSGILAICMGMFCGLRLERIKSYSYIAAFFFLMISASELIPGILNDGYHIDIWPIKKLFSSIFLPDQDWTIDYQYGLQIEPFRWNCVLFWCFLFFAGVISKVSQHSSKIRLPLIGICLVFSLTNLWGFFHSGSVIDLSEAPNSVFRTDQVYYRNEYPREEPADFQISSYDMHLHIGRQLNANVSMSVTALESSDAYRFTLYHTYHINRVYDENGKNIPFFQDGDYFTVASDNNVRIITVEYEGFSPMFYSNQQGVCLPGCFPYYPWAGYKQIFYTTPDSEVGLASFIPRTDSPKATYSVNLSSSSPIYSNLGVLQSKETVCGTTNGLSLMSGMLETKELDGYVMISCWSQSDFFHFSPEYFDTLQETITHLEEERGYDEHIDLKKYTLFETNETMLNRCGYGLAVPFDDHIFLAAYPDVKCVAQAITYFIHEGPPLTIEEKMQSEGVLP